MIQESAVAIDIETTGLQWADRMLTVSMARKGESGIETLVLNTGYHQEQNLFGLMGAPLDSRDEHITPMPMPEARRQFSEFIGRRDTLVMHNTSFDLPYLYRAGLLTPKETWTDYRIFDTMVMARATGAHDGVGLDALCEEIGIQDPVWERGKKNRAHLEDEAYEDVETYSGLDARYTLELAFDMWPTAEIFYGPFGCGGLLDEESQWVKLVSELRYYGLHVDQEVIEGLRVDLRRELDELMGILTPAGIKGPNDRTSILRWCGNEKLTRFLRTTEKGNKSTDNQSMGDIALGYAHPDDAKRHEIVTLSQTITRARSVEKALSTWITGTLDEMDRAGRVHPLFTASGAVSNRLTCRLPNTQAYPAAYKPFGARKGYDLWSLDWSQAELRLATIYAREPRFAEILATPGADPHMETALLIFGQHATADHRQLAKRANFGSIYGAGWRAIVKATGCTEAVAKELLRNHKALFRMLAKTSKRAEKTWVDRGYLVLMSGKRLYATTDDKERRPYKAFNQLIQGAVAETIKRAMIQMHELPIVLANQVHDSIEIEVARGDTTSIAAAVEIMKHRSFDAKIQAGCVPFVPLPVDVVMYGGKAA
jgi:DNA polymerase-1